MKLLLTILAASASLLCGQSPTRAVSDTLADYNAHPGVITAAQLMQALFEAAAETTVSADLNHGHQLALNLVANRQVGAPAGVGAGTSLLSLKSVTDLISGALDSGAFNKTTQGAVATFQANVIGAFRLFSGECPAKAQQKYPACISEDNGPWRGLSVALSFDSSRQDQVSPSDPANPNGSIGAVFLRAKNGLSAANVRYDFYRPRDAGSKDLKDAWTTGIDDLRTKAKDYLTALGSAPGAQAEALKSQTAFNDLLMKTDPPDRLAVAQQFVADYLAAPGHEMDAGKHAAYAKARQDFLKNEVKFFQDTLQRKLFTLEFTDQRPKDEPEYGSVRFITSFGAGSKYTDPESGAKVPNWQITLNAAADFYYNSADVQKDRVLRDFQVALQADRRLWRWTFLNQPTFTLAGYYQRLTDNSVLEFNSDAIAPGTGIALPKPANVILSGTKGDIGIGQAKLTIPLGNAGVSFPIAVSWSNRTELLNLPGNDVRGHFGFQFDVDKLLSSLKK